MPELLAPAGNFISLRAVLENGADAVYFGLDEYNMRANARNFSLDDLAKISKIASDYNAKTYLCTNIILKESQNDAVFNTSDVLDESFVISHSFDDSYRTNFFSPKDMCMIEHIPELIKTGVSSFKIEGRARSPDYGAMVTGIYREAIDSYLNDPDDYKVNPQWMEELKSVFNRGFDTGFYFDTPFETSETNQSKYIKKDIGQVVNFYNKVSVAELRVWDDLKIGDKIMIQGETTGSVTHIIESMQVDGADVNHVSKNSNVGVLMPSKVRKNDFVYKLVERSQQ